tara:strand:+ start:144 stop:398 length:255 start_codon:yes stop_codon:yes gene_type:complete
MWIEKEVILNNKKVICKINFNENTAELEIPFYKNWDNLGTIKIDNDNYVISDAVNVGARDEIILMKLNKEQKNDNKSDKSRKTT